MDILKSIEHEQLKNKVPELRIGNTVRVHVRIKEGNKERIQVFEGIIIKKQGGGVNETFTVRRISYGVGVEKSFLVHSPMVEKVEVVRVGKARRAKLYYLRDRVGKAAKTKEKVGARIETREIIIKEEEEVVPGESVEAEEATAEEVAEVAAEVKAAEEKAAAEKAEEVKEEVKEEATVAEAVEEPKKEEAAEEVKEEVKEEPAAEEKEAEEEKKDKKEDKKEE